MNGTRVMRVGIPTTVNGLAQRPSAHNARPPTTPVVLARRILCPANGATDTQFHPTASTPRPAYPQIRSRSTESGRNAHGNYPGSAALIRRSAGNHPALAGCYPGFAEHHLALTKAYSRLTEDYTGFTRRYPGLTVAYPAFTKPYPDVTVPCFSMIYAKSAGRAENQPSRNQFANHP